MRIIFAGTPEFAVPPLRALLTEHEVVAVFTQPDRRGGRGKKLLAPPVKQVAQEHNIPVLQPASLKDQAEIIASFQADVMVVVAYGMLLPANILELPRYGCINIHASLLPRWRGAAPIQRAIQAGDSETGVAIMQMETGLDTGPVFDMLNVAISSADTSATMHDKLSELGAIGVLATLAKLSEDSMLRARAQDHQNASYAHKITKQEARIDWHQSAQQVHNQIRAFVPWPVAETHHKETRIRIWKSLVEAEPNLRAESKLQANASPGTILAVEPDIAVACGEGVINLVNLQRDGGKAVNAREFRNGYALSVGDQFSFRHLEHSGDAKSS